MSQICLNINSKYPQSFTGKERDSETGFSYFGARYYDSDILTGWLSVDPLADKYPSLSPYNYCAWNPVKLVDPDGEEAMDNDDEWKYNTTYGLLLHVSENGGKDQQIVHCVSTIGNQEILKETVSFNGQIEDMFDFSIINDSWDRIIDGSIQIGGGLVTSVGGVSVGVSSFGLAFQVGGGIFVLGATQMATGVETVADGVFGRSSGNKYKRQDIAKSICSLDIDFLLTLIIDKNTDVALNKGVSKVARIATGIATLGLETAWSATQIVNTLFPERRSQLPKGAIVTKHNINNRPRVGVGLMPY